MKTCILLLPRISIGTNGLGGFLCGLVVAYKQVIPEHVINVFKRPVIRVKYTPSLIILLHLILFLVGLINITFYMHTSGIVITWIYLRYFKFYNGVRGDRSETFSFASFFPDSFHKSLKPISTATYTVCFFYLVSGKVQLIACFTPQSHTNHGTNGNGSRTSRNLRLCAKEVNSSNEGLWLQKSWKKDWPNHEYH
jgi:hypothetical protein